MFSAYQNATRTYRDIGLETRAAASDPVTLILMLYDGAIDALTQAQAHFKSGDRSARQAAISRAVRIVDEGLSAALDANGGEITHHLRELYGYMTRRMLSASLAVDAAPLAEVQGLLKDLRGAWQEIAQRATGRPVGGLVGSPVGSPVAGTVPAMQPALRVSSARANAQAGARA